jgi:hypothetical protein
MRPPRIFVYSTTSLTVQDITPLGRVTSLNPWGVDQLVLTTIGFRAAAVVGGNIIFTGPSLYGGLNLFAFRTSDFTLVAETNINGFQNLRQFVWAQGVLYAGVKTDKGGSILRYTGTIPSAPSAKTNGPALSACNTCFTFVDVQDFPDEVAALLMGNDARVYAGTWPVNGTAGIYMSPPVPQGGFNAGGPLWTSVFNVTQYEPDPVQATAYGIGSLAMFGGYLYFGTQNPPFEGVVAYANAYGDPVTQTELQNVLLNSFRSTAFFRISGQITGTPFIELLYGNAQLPAYTPSSYDPHVGVWALTPNKLTGQRGIYGAAGFNNPFNAYTWSSAIFQGKLYIGTYDWTFLFGLIPPPTIQAFRTAGIQPAQPTFAGADLFSFANTTSPAVTEDKTGLGNPMNYGVRNLLPSTNVLYAGMANSMNLLTTPGQPEGGWELIQLAPVGGAAPH